MPSLITVVSRLICCVLCLSSCVNADDNFLTVLQGKDTDQAKSMLAENPTLLEQEMECGWSKPMRPLVYATSQKNYAMMKVLIDAGADLNAANRDWSPIGMAARWNDLVGLRLLLDAGAKNQIQRKYSTRGSTALAVAAGQGHRKIVDELLGRGISVNDGDVLAQATYGKKWELVKFLLDRGADPKHDEVFVYATEVAPLEIVKLLVEHGADANAQRFYGGALAMACNEIEKVKLLVTAGADVNGSKQNGVRPLHRAALWGNLEVVKFLLSKNADVNVKKKDGQTPLDLAIRRGHLAVVKRLLDAGADRTTHANVALAELDAVKLALANGVDVNLALPSDYAPQLIHTAIKFERDKVLKFLLDKGANVDAKIGDVTALHQAVTQKSLVLTKLLLDHGADPNVVFDEFRYGTGSLTPLHILAGGRINSELDKETAKLKDQQTEVAIAKLLLKSGADKNLKSEMGQTALQIAQQYKNHLVPLLREKPAEETD